MPVSFVHFLFNIIERSSSRYQSGQHQSFGPLRVINEDRVAGRTGFGTHSHREFEIFTYVVAGEIEQLVSFFRFILYLVANQFLHL